MSWSDLGATMILFAYYLIMCALIPSALRIYAGVPREWVRKLQHLGYSLSVFLLIHLFSTWYAAIIGAFSLVIIGYPVLLLLEKTSFYQRVFVDRKPSGGELRMQLLLVQLTFALLMFLFWGLMGTRWHFLIPTAVMAWGFGDAAAAVVGKAFGRRAVVSRFVDGSKTYVGSVAMMMAAALAIFFTLLVYAGRSWQASLFIAVLVAPVCALVELVSRRGLDTITVPLVTASFMLPMMHIVSYLGW